MGEVWERTPLGDVTTQRVEAVELDDKTEYSNLGVKWYAEGTFQRPPKLGSEIKAAKLFRVRPGQFVYNRLFATEGSFALVRPEEAETVASNEFPVFDVDPSRLLGEYLSLYFQQPSVWATVAEQCVGTTKSRLRWKEERFRSYTIPLPSLEEQRRIVDLVGALDDTIAAAESNESTLRLFTSLHRDVAYWQATDRTRLDAICQVDGKLVSPTGTRSSLPHVGAERIVSGTGDLVGVVSAAEDGVTSGKYQYGPQHVIYSKIRPNLRKVALPSMAGLCSADAYPLLPAAGVPRRYLQQLLLSSPFTEQATSRSGRTKMPKINRAELMSIEIPGHGRDERQGLAERFETLDAARLAAQTELHRLRALRSNLLTALLSGQHEIPESYDELMEEAV